ncbi:MAG TPA: GAF domain-containing protein [Acidimicrobiales bacterium]|nr:GAF domain-containing protein [Acidimicrobiales bacterium]
MDDFARLRHLAETQRLLGSGSLGTDQLLDVVTERAREITAADAGMVELVDRDELVCRASTGSMREVLGRRLKGATTISGRCARLAVPMRCVDTEYDTRVDRAGCRRLGIRSIVVVPVMKDDAAVGVLKVISSRPDHFTESDVEVLQEMAAFVADAAASQFAAVEREGRHGQVTTLADRQMCVEWLERACTSADRDGTVLAVLLIRLNGVGPVQEGLLRLVAEALTKIVREGDALIRLGDEFILVCGNAGESDTYGLIARISSAVRRVGESSPGYEQLSAGVGLAWRDDDNRSPEQLLSTAGAAVVRAG